MPQQLGEKRNTLDEPEQYITIEAATAEELEEDDESSALLFGKYDKYFHNGDGNYERLYRIAKLILPNALYVTWRGFIDFQVEPGAPCITNKKVAEYTNKNVRTIELNIQRLRQAGFVRTHHILRGENWVVEKNFSGMYRAIVEYMQWESSSTYMPPTREYFEVDEVDKDVCSKVLHFNNYRRILYNKKPGPKRKKVYPEEQTFIDGVFRELTTVQDLLSGKRATEPLGSQLDASSVSPEKTSTQPPVATANHEEQVSMHEEGRIAPLEKPLQMEDAVVHPVEFDSQLCEVSEQAEGSAEELLILGKHVVGVGAQPMVDRSVSEGGSFQHEVPSVQAQSIGLQAEPIRLQPDTIQDLGVEERVDMELGQDGEEMRNRIIDEYQRIAKEESQEAAMQWMATQNLEWMQPQDWEDIFEQCNVSEDLGDEMKLEEDVVQQELAFESEDRRVVQEEGETELLSREESEDIQAVKEEGKLEKNDQEDLDLVRDFEKIMDDMVLVRRDHIEWVHKWHGYLYRLYDKHGRWLIDTNLVRYPARNQPKVPFTRYLKADLAYRCALRPCSSEYNNEELEEDLNDLLVGRETIYGAINGWDDDNITLSNQVGFNKVNQAYLDRLSSEDLKRLKIMVYEPEPEPNIQVLSLKEKYIAEQKRLRDEKDKAGENGTA